MTLAQAFYEKYENEYSNDVDFWDWIQEHANEGDFVFSSDCDCTMIFSDLSWIVWDNGSIAPVQPNKFDLDDWQELNPVDLGKNPFEVVDPRFDLWELCRAKQVIEAAGFSIEEA